MANNTDSGRSHNGERAQLPSRGSAVALLRGVNLRDVGLLSSNLKRGKLFRSSQVVRYGQTIGMLTDESGISGLPPHFTHPSAADLEDAGIVAVIDLRQRNVDCGKAEHEFLKQVQRQAGKITAVCVCVLGGVCMCVYMCVCICLCTYVYTLSTINACIWNNPSPYTTHPPTPTHLHTHPITHTHAMAGSWASSP